MRETLAGAMYSPAASLSISFFRSITAKFPSDRHSPMSPRREPTTARLRNRDAQSRY